MSGPPEYNEDREKIFTEAMRVFIESLPDDECFKIDVKKDKNRRFTSFSVRRKGAP